MKSGMCQFLKGMGMGLIVGCTAGVVGTCVMKKSRKGLKHSAGRAMHSFGDLLENVTEMF